MPYDPSFAPDEMQDPELQRLWEDELIRRGLPLGIHPGTPLPPEVPAGPQAPFDKDARGNAGPITAPPQQPSFASRFGAGLGLPVQQPNQPTGFLSRLKAAVPGMIRGAVAGASTPNIAGGGGTDVMRAMQAGQQANVDWDLMQRGLARENVTDAQKAQAARDASQLSAAHTNYYRAQAQPRTEAAPRNAEEAELYQDWRRAIGTPAEGPAWDRLNQYKHGPGTTSAIAATKEARALAQQEFQDTISSLTASPPANAREYQNRLGGVSPGVRARILTAVPAEGYDPKTSPRMLRQLGLTPEQQAVAEARANPTPVPGRDVPFPPDVEAQKRKLAQESRATIQNVMPGIPATPSALTGEEYLKTLSRGAAAQVRQISLGQAALPSASTRSQAAIQLRNAVFTYDPTFTEERYPTRRATSIAYATGKPAIELNAMNTVLGHTGELSRAGDALKNGDIRALNAVANSLGVAIGRSPVVTYKTIVHRVGPELIRAYVGAGGDESERREAGADFNENNSPDQIRAAAAVTAKLLSSKIQASLFNYHRSMNFTPGDPRGQELVRRFFTPEAIGVMDRLVGPGWNSGGAPNAAPSGAPAPGSETSPGGAAGPGRIQVRDPRGKIHTFPDQDSANAFKKAAGIP